MTLNLIQNLLVVMALHADGGPPAVQPAVLDTWFRAQLPPVSSPLEAEAEETWVTTYGGKRTERTARSKAYLSGDGRVRIDFAEGEERLAWVLTKSTVALVDRAKNEAIATWAADEAPPEDTPSPGAGSVGRPTDMPLPRMIGPTERLEDRIIEGRTCQGFRRHVRGVGRLDPSGERRDERLGTEDFVVETWIAPDLAQVVLETRRSQHEFVSMRLTSIREREPEASLFTIPAATPASVQTGTALRPE